MTLQAEIGRALAELVSRLSPEEKREFARWLSWEELEALRREEPMAGSAEEETRSVRRLGEPRLYVGATADGLALELPAGCIAAFMERLPLILSVSSVEVYLRRNGSGEEHQVSAEDFAGFLDVHLDALLEGSLMVELEGATLVSGGGGCMLLTMEGISGELQRRLAS